MRKGIYNFCISLVVFTSFLVISCDPISLKTTIDNLVLGWTRAVTLTSPVNEAQVADKTPLLDWEDAGGAVKYEVQIVEAVDQFENATSIDVTESQYEIAEEMVIGADRLWRVRAVNSDGVGGEWSENRSFEVVPSALPKLVNTLDLGTQPWAIEVDGDYLYTSAGASGVKIFDISSRAAPVLIDTFSTVNGVWDIDIQGDYAYISESLGSDPYYVYLLDISDPSNVIEKDSYAVGNQLYGLQYGGIALYVGFFDGYYRFDSSPPTLDSSPELVDLSPPPDAKRVNCFDLYGSYLVYTIDGEGLRILQLSGNIEVGSAAAADPANFSNSMVTVYGHYAYVTTMDSSYIEIFNIEDVTNPVAAATYTLEGGAGNITVVDHFAFVQMFDGSVLILDVENPAVPVEFGTTDAAEVGTSWHVISGNYLYGTNFSDGELKVVDLIPEGD